MGSVYDRKTIGRMGGGMSDYMVIVFKLKVIAGWLKRWVRLLGQRKPEEYKRLFGSKNGELRGEIGEMWGKFKEVFIDPALL